MSSFKRALHPSRVVALCLLVMSVSLCFAGCKRSSEDKQPNSRAMSPSEVPPSFFVPADTTEIQFDESISLGKSGLYYSIKESCPPHEWLREFRAYYKNLGWTPLDEQDPESLSGSAMDDNKWYEKKAGDSKAKLLTERWYRVEHGLIPEAVDVTILYELGNDDKPTNGTVSIFHYDYSYAETMPHAE